MAWRRYPSVIENSSKFLTLVSNASFKKPVDNNADGNCLLEAVLDSARKHMPTKVFKSIFPFASMRFGDKRPKEDAQEMRKRLLKIAKEDLKQRKSNTTRNSSANFVKNAKDNIQILKATNEWLTTDHINYISNTFDVCVCLYDNGSGYWTVVTPFSKDNSEKYDNLIFIVIDNDQSDFSDFSDQTSQSSSQSSELAGSHFYAAVMDGDDLKKIKKSLIRRRTAMEGGSAKCNVVRPAPPGNKHKYAVHSCYGGEEKDIYFGLRGYSDYLEHKEEERRKNYRARHR